MIDCKGRFTKYDFCHIYDKLTTGYDMTCDCHSVLKHVFKCYIIFSDIHDNRKRVAGLIDHGKLTQIYAKSSLRRALRSTTYSNMNFRTL